MPHSYRCPFCHSTRPARMRRVRSPLGTLAQVIVVILGLPLLAWALFFWSGHLAGQVEQPLTVPLILAVVLAVSLGYGLFVGLERLLRVEQQVCPDCKMRLS